jgi:hypothetical protein
MGDRQCPVSYTRSFYKGLLPCITLNKITMIAMTSSRWIMPPVPYPIKPMAQIMIRITAMVYKRLPIKYFLVG